MRKDNAYSLAVLVITIAVILIITATAITSLKNSKDERQISNFIADIKTLEEYVKEYYADTGLLPVGNKVGEIPFDMRNQINENDNENYYYIDISRLQNLRLNYPDEAYIVNEKSLVVYNLNGIGYRGFVYYTNTPELLGMLSTYRSLDEEMIIVGNPKVWSVNAKLKVVLPRQSNFENWTFKWDFGPVDAQYFVSNGQSFDYGDTLVAMSNGVYTIYVRDNTRGRETVKNIVVSKVDNSDPKYVYNDGIIGFEDAETGISELRYKVKTSSITNLNTYLQNGKGNTIQTLLQDIQTYETSKNTILEEWEAYVTAYNNESTEGYTPEQLQAREQEYTNRENQMMADIAALNAQYQHITNESNQYALYVEDYSENGIVILPTVNEPINLQVILNSVSSSINNDITNIITGEDITILNIVNSIRRQIPILGGMEAKCNDNIALIQTAIQGLNNITSALNNMNTSINNYSNGQSTIQQTELQLNNYLQNISSIVETTTYNNIYLLDGSLEDDEGVRTELGAPTSPQGELYYEIIDVSPAALSKSGITFYIDISSESKMNSTIQEIGNAISKVNNEVAKLEAIINRINYVKEYRQFMQPKASQILSGIENDSDITYSEVQELIYLNVESIIDTLILNKLNVLKEFVLNATTESSPNNRIKLQHKVNQMIDEFSRRSRYTGIGNIKLLDGTFQNIPAMTPSMLGISVLNVSTNQNATASLEKVNNAILLVQTQINEL